MPFLTKGKTNWKYILIVLILAMIVSGGILGYLRYFKREISSLSKFLEIKKPEKKGLNLTTDKTEYKQGENITIILDTGGKEIYLKKNVFTGKILISKEYEVYKLQGTNWIKLRIDTYCGNVMVCGESGPLLPACPAPPQPECNKITNRITWVWDQKTWEYVEKTCVNIPYTDEELKQVEPGTYKIRVTYYDSNSCTGIPKYLETQFKITEETANWKTYRFSVQELKETEGLTQEKREEVEKKIIERKLEGCSFEIKYPPDWTAYTWPLHGVIIPEGLFIEEKPETHDGCSFQMSFYGNPEKEKYCFPISFSSGKSDPEKCNKIFNQMLSTFRFIEKVSIFINVGSFDLINKTFEGKTTPEGINIKILTTDSTKFYRTAAPGWEKEYFTFSEFHSLLKNWSGPPWPFTVEGVLEKEGVIKANEVYFIAQ